MRPISDRDNGPRPGPKATTPSGGSRGTASNRAGGTSRSSSRGSSSRASASATTATAAVPYDQTQAGKASAYGWSEAVLNSDPELKALFDQATATGPYGNWTTDHFVAKVRDTKWFKTHTDTARQAIILQKADPATYNQRVSAAAGQATTMAGTVGARLTPAQMQQIGAESVMYGWNNDQLRQRMEQYVTSVKDSTGTAQYAGGAANYQQQYTQMAGQYGTTVADNTMNQWVKDSVMGRTTVDQVRNNMVALASSRYPSLAARLKAGETLQDIAAPYMQSYAKVLELNPNTIALTDNLVQSALSGTDDKGQPSTKSVWQFEQDLRNDPRYMKTQGAQDSVMNVGKKVLNDFGLLGQSFNHLYGEHFVLPEAAVDESVALLPGLDGRKMSKSYDNIIALFAPPEQIRKQIAGIVTDSRAPGEPKEVEGSALFQIYRAFASPEETAALRQSYADGIGWGDAKQLLFERIDREIAPMRARYQSLIDDPAELERILRAGAEKARARATPFLAQLRQAVGLRTLSDPGTRSALAKAPRIELPSFKQYREPDGRFHFKLVDAKGKLLLQSQGFDSAREAGQTIAGLRKSLSPPNDFVAIGKLAPGVAAADVAAALQTLADAD